LKEPHCGAPVAVIHSLDNRELSATPDTIDVSRARPGDPFGHGFLCFQAPSDVSRPRARNGIDAPAPTSAGKVSPEPSDRVDHRPISRTKVTPAVCREPTLPRPRLLEWLEENVGRRVVLIVSEAGYGKTTLLADFSRHTVVRCVWYKLDPTDRNWISFVTYLVAAVREAIPDFGQRVLRSLHPTPGVTPQRDAVVEMLSAEFARLDGRRTVLIFDDYHSVDDAEDIRYVLTRLIKTAPDDATFLLSSRGRPSLPLARLAAQDQVCELGTSELRFSRGETRELFSATYEGAMDQSLVDEIDQRTQGWAACLRLVHSSIRGKSETELRAFVRDLSGAEGPIYDFLAQELLEGLPPLFRRLTLFASLLDRVVSSHVAALLADEPLAPTSRDIDAWLEAAESVGLLNKTADTPPVTRFHPLMRDFLRRHLSQLLTEAELRQLHLRIARAAEEGDWITACNHYLAAGAPNAAATVLGGSAIEALGTGEWRVAADILQRVRAVDGTANDPTAAVLTAFHDIEDSRLDQVIDALTVIDLQTVAPVTRALVRHALYRAYWRRGDTQELSTITAAVLADVESPEIFRDIARLHSLVYDDEGTTSYAELSAQLTNAAERQRTSGLYFFASVSFHNAMVVEYSRANYEIAIGLGHRALEMYALTGTGATEVQATHAFLARCHAELGSRHESEHFNIACAEPVVDAEPLADCALLAASEGREELAAALSTSMARMCLEQPVHGVALSHASIAQATVHLFVGDTDAALTSLAHGTEHRGIATELNATTVLALAQGAAGRSGFASVARLGLQRARRQGVRHWEVRLAIAVAAGDEHASRLQGAVAAAAATGRLALADCADVLCQVMHLLEPHPETLQESIAMFPGRWLPALRRQLDRGLTPAARSCAALLEHFGTASDVPRLRAFEKTYLRGSKASGLGKELISRVSPQLHISDLGPSALAIDDRTIAFAGMRRRSASLLAYLITRRQNTATREQVLDSLWPDLDPASASNSLNQTMYFLRRDIDPWYDDDLSMDYVHAEGDMVWIDPSKVSIASVEFEGLAETALSSPQMDIQAAKIAVDRYAGRFCPEFEYEEWSSAWRDRLHATYLHLTLEIGNALVAQDRLSEATAVMQRGLALEPDAVELEGRLIWLYGRLGSRAAAAEQYAHYSKSHREQLGLEAPSLTEILGSRKPHDGLAGIRQSAY
jgi:ATP/maltotriose-dependent transcriptional regulator MalT/DNA-binding SARP family transcriptional activator